MSEVISNGKTPEAWAETLAGHGVHVSARLLRSKARKAGHFYKIGHLILLTPAEVEAVLTPGRPAEP